MPPRKVTFFAFFLTSKIITMLVRILFHGYKHDSATGFVCFACFPLSFGCPRISCQVWLPQNFLSGVLELVCFFTLFVFVTLGQLGEQREGKILSLCFKDWSQSSFHAGWGRRGILKNLGLVPYSHLNYFHLFHIENL